MNAIWFKRIAFIAACLALVVVVLGAYVRLSDAGLGCPDWPGCYGHIDVPEAAHDVARANQAWPGRPVEAGKAWKEMIHRYFAGSLGLLILALAVMAIRRGRRPNQPFWLPLGLVVLVMFQALLGMWTVTKLLKPVVVSMHLLGGMATLALLWLLFFRASGRVRTRLRTTPGQRRLITAALVAVACQIALGGWTSTNYAAVACPDFPTCQGQWWPAGADFSDGFTLFAGSHAVPAGGLPADAKVAIHFTHRLGALIVFLLVGGMSLWLWLRSRDSLLRHLGLVAGVLMIVQIVIGVCMVEFALPLPLAVAHNGNAALFLISMVALARAAWSPPRNELGG
ncbi:MAG: COX15/CtaA family protein [Gammaproteobacteria bacterium]|jgi:cytochrome c oxidase assembly protein subunit 15